MNYHSFRSPLSPLLTASIFPRHNVIVHLNRTSFKTQHPEYFLFRKSPWQCLFILEMLSCFPLWLSKYNATRKWLTNSHLFIRLAPIIVALSNKNKYVSSKANLFEISLKVGSRQNGTCCFIAAGLVDSTGTLSALVVFILCICLCIFISSYLYHVFVYIPILKYDFFENHLESFPDCENVFCT